jgi:hypothetical protein
MFTEVIGETRHNSQNLWFFNQKISPKTLASNISMLEPIKDNDNYKPHAKNIQIYQCLLKLLRKQDTILNIGDFSTKN